MEAEKVKTQAEIRKHEIDAETDKEKRYILLKKLELEDGGGQMTSLDDREEDQFGCRGLEQEHRGGNEA